MWGQFKDWMFGPKCEIHGQRPSSFFHRCLVCLAIEIDNEQIEREAAEREARIEEIAEAIRRANRGSS